MIYFTADSHFCHGNIIKHCNRPFSTVDEMNEALIQNWNNKVNGNDTVYILGDMFFRCKIPDGILGRLKGKKKLIAGNHDSSWMTKTDASKYFVSVDNYMEVSVEDKLIVLCHYPLLSWKHNNRSNSYMVHGHIHNSKKIDFWPLLANRKRILNAGVDINGFVPVSLDEMIENNRIFKQTLTKGELL